MMSNSLAVAFNIPFCKPANNRRMAHSPAVFTYFKGSRVASKGLDGKDFAGGAVEGLRRMEVTWRGECGQQPWILCQCLYCPSVRDLRTLKPCWSDCFCLRSLPVIVGLFIREWHNPVDSSLFRWSGNAACGTRGAKPIDQFTVRKNSMHNKMCISCIVYVPYVKLQVTSYYLPFPSPASLLCHYPRASACLHALPVALRVPYVLQVM